MLTVFLGSDAKAARDVAKPLNSLTLVERDAVLAEMCRKIKAASGNRIRSLLAQRQPRGLSVSDTNDRRTASTILQIDKGRPFLTKLSC